MNLSCKINGNTGSFHLQPKPQQRKNVELIDVTASAISLAGDYG
jgi:hypothetical protein